MGDGEYVELTIRDTGSGMSPEVVARAFEPFFTTKDVGKGTGLGLSMVYSVARQSGGTARIDSTPGDGTAVRLYFPRADDDDARSEKPSAERITERVASDATVLVIDEDPDVRCFIAESLGELGYRVSEASDGSAGLLMFAEHRPDLVIIDYIMPGLSGAEVARRIRAAAPAQRILFVSGYSETEAITSAAPGTALLTKPFRADALDIAVRDALAAAPVVPPPQSS